MFSMAKSLSNILRWGKNTLIAGIVGTGMFMSGGYAYADKKDDVLLNLLKKGTINSQTTPEQKKAADYLEDVIKEGIEKQDRLDEAEKNKNEIIDYIEKSKDEKKQQNIDKYDIERSGKWKDIITPSSFTCTGYEDLNNDGAITKNELINLGNYFKYTGKSLEVVCGSTWYNAKGSKVLSKITDSKTGRVIDVNQTQIPSNATVRFTYLKLDKTEDGNEVKDYLVEWFVDGKLIPSRTTHFFVDFGNKENQPKQERYFFSCNSWTDLDGDNIADYPNEYSGIKNKFGDDENILLVSHDEKNKKGDKWKMEVYNSAGDKVYETNENLSHDGTILSVKLKNNGNYGDYKAVWSLNDKYVGSTEFEIVPSQK